MIVEIDFKKFQKIDSSYFCGKNYFGDNGTQNYLVFQSNQKYFKTDPVSITSTLRGSSTKDYLVLEWKSKGLSNEIIKPFTKSCKILAPLLRYAGAKTRLEFKGSCLKQSNFTFNHKTIVNMYVGYEMNKNNPISSYPTLENCLFGMVALTKNLILININIMDIVLVLVEKESFSIGNGSGQNAIIVGADMSSSAHAKNKTKNIFVLGEGITQGLDDITLTAKKKYSINFTANKKFCLSLHYNGANSYLFVNGTEIIKFKAKDPEIVANALCVGNRRLFC